MSKNNYPEAIRIVLSTDAKKLLAEILMIRPGVIVRAHKSIISKEERCVSDLFVAHQPPTKEPFSKQDKQLLAVARFNKIQAIKDLRAGKKEKISLIDAKEYIENLLANNPE